MPFLKDNQGAIIYRLSSEEQIDQDAYGMLRNNAVEHIVGVSYNQLDSQRELRFATEGLRSTRDFFAGRTFNRQQFVGVLMGVADAFADAEEYMLSAESFSGSLDTTFVDDHLNIALTYVPIVGFAGCSGARAFICDIRRCLRPDSPSGDLSYLQAIDHALNQADDFSVTEFKKLLASLTLKPKQSGLSTAGAGQGFAPAGELFAAPNPHLGVGAVSPGQQPSGDAFSGQHPAGGAIDVGYDPNRGASGPQGVPGQLSVPPANGSTGGVGGANVPSAGGAPSSFGGMAIPGMDSQQFTDGESSKKSLFGKNKKEKKPSSGKMSRAEKKAAKEAEKAAKNEAKAAKKRKKGKSGDDEKLGGRFTRKKTKGAPSFPMPSQDAPGGVPFPIPGVGQGVVPGGSGEMPVPPGVQTQGNDVPDGGSSGFDFGYQPAQQSPQLGSMGERYDDSDFGITEVHGIEPKGDGENDGGIPGPFGQQPEPRGLPATAYLYRESTGEKCLIDKTPFRVGRRRSEVDFHIAERPKVSRVHAVITFDGSRFVIRDNKSMNHTAINGRRIDPEESIMLVDGDFIEMGDERFRFMLG